MTPPNLYALGRRIGRTAVGRTLRPIVAFALMLFYSLGILGMFLFLVLAFRPEPRRA